MLYKSVLALLCALFFAASASQTPINILGYIKTFDGKPISGVTVTLVKQNQVTTTDANGMFKFPATGVLGTIAGSSPVQSISIRNRTLSVSIGRAAPVSLELFDLKGALVQTVQRGELREGSHDFIIPVKSLSQQVFILRVAVGAERTEYTVIAAGNCLSLAGAVAAKPEAGQAVSIAKQALPAVMPQKSNVVDTIRMSHPEYNGEFFTFSSYVDTFNLVLAKLNWQLRFPATFVVTYDDSTLQGYQEFGKWKPGVAGKYHWLDSVGRSALRCEYRDSLEATAAYRGSKLPDTFIYHIAKPTSVASNSTLAKRSGAMSNTGLDFPDDTWLYQDLTGTWCCFSGCTASVAAGKILCGRKELLGCITHELFGHGMSNQNGYGSHKNFFEGFTDFCRYENGGFDLTAAAKRPAFTTIDTITYQDMAFFFGWMEREKHPQLLYHLNMYLAKGKTWAWATDWPAFVKLLGAPALGTNPWTLWQEYQATFN
jgi:hypothetical protein